MLYHTRVWSASVTRCRAVSNSPNHACTMHPTADVAKHPWQTTKVRNPSTSRTATLSDVGRHHTACMAAAQHSESSAAASVKVASADYRIRPRVLRQHLGHSGAMPAATAEMSERPNACPECAQHGGREYGHLERYMKVYKVRNLRYSKSGRNPVHLG